MIAVIALILVRILPFELSAAVVRLVAGLYLIFSARARRELTRAVNELGANHRSRGEYLEQTALNLALMAKMGTGFASRLEAAARIEGEENLRGLSGGVVATFHYGPWELMTEVFSRRGYRIGALVGSQKIGILDRYLAALRRRAGLRDIRTIEEARSALADGFFMATLYDKTRRAKGERLGVPFKDYSSSVLPARLAACSDSVLVPVMCRFSRCRLEVSIGKPGEDTASFFEPFFTKNPCQWLVWGE